MLQVMLGPGVPGPHASSEICRNQKPRLVYPDRSGGVLQQVVDLVGHILGEHTPPEPVWTRLGASIWELTISYLLSRSPQPSLWVVRLRRSFATTFSILSHALRSVNPPIFSPQSRPNGSLPRRRAAEFAQE